MGRTELVKLSTEEYKALKKVRELVTVVGIRSFSPKGQEIVKKDGSALGIYVHLGCQLIVEHCMSYFPEEVKECLG